MTTTSAGLAVMPCLELAAAWRAEVITGDPGYHGVLQSWSRRC